jgi:hypothetical protein
VELVDVAQSAAKTMKAVWVLLLVAGCDRLFGFDEVPAPEIDAPIGGCLISGEHDDDGDCVPDSVDDCPGMPDPAQGDRDGDHVGDACDPDPLMGGNTLRVFVPNTDPLTLSNWSVSGAWSITGDALADADTANSSEDWAYWHEQDLMPVEVQTIVHIDTLGDIENRVGVAFAVPPVGSGLPSSEFSCAIRRATDGVHLDAFAGSTNKEPLVPSAALQDGAVYTLRARVDKNGLSCDLQGASPAEHQSAQISETVPAAGHASVYSLQTAVHFDSIAVYTVLP